ncbi:MAG: hypothetical protein V3T08_09640 [Gemmatimonadota bacterium]
MNRAAVLLLALVGCAGAPISFNAVAPPNSRDLYACSMQELASMNYVIDDVDRESGYIRARKQTSGTARFLFAGEAKHSALIITVFEAINSGEQMLRVTAGVITEDTWGIGRGAESMGSPSEETTAEAQALLATCAGSAGVIEAAEEQRSADTGDPSATELRAWTDRDRKRWTVSIERGPSTTLTFSSVSESYTVIVDHAGGVRELSDEELQGLLDEARAS